MNTTTQYSPLAQNWQRYAQYNERSTAAWRHVIGDVTGLSVLDLGCGDGADLAWFGEKGAAQVWGIDVDPVMVHVTRERGLVALQARAEELPFEAETFDLVVSKWALQTCPDLKPVYKEAHRVLKQGGWIVILLVHPLRQFMEQKRLARDYWSHEEVTSVLFDGQLTVNEPMHTLEDVLGPHFLELFELREFHEKQEYGVERVDGATYPHYLLFRAQKRA